MRCGTIRRALCANKDQTADCTWSRKHRVHGLVAQKRRAGVLATAGARAWPTLHARGRERSLQVCRTVRMHDADHANLPKHTRPDPKMHQDPRKGAIRAGDSDMRHHLGDILGLGKDAATARESRNQTIKCRTKIKESNTTCNTTIPYHPEKESKQSKYR